MRTLIRQQLKESQEVFITSNRELRREILRIFDQTFSITYALQLIAIVVAIFGIVNTLILLVMERERDDQSGPAEPTRQDVNRCKG